MEFLELLRYAFIWRGLSAGLLVGVSCSLLGVFLVLRRWALIGDGLAHVSFGAIALALFLGWLPIYAAIPLVIIGALIITWLGEKQTLSGDAAIGMVASAGIAFGVILASIAKGINVELLNYLFGNVLAVSRGELWMAGGLLVIILFCLWRWYGPLAAAAFNEDLARVAGIKVSRINSLLAILTAVTVILAVRIVGTLLISALIIIPAVAALRVARGFKIALWWAAGFAVITVGGGMVLAFALNLPPSAMIILFGILIYLIVQSFAPRTPLARH